MIVRKATLADLQPILQVISDAKQKMRRTGNMKQWTDGYPSAKVILADIDAGHGYVCLQEDGTIGGYYAMIPGAEPTYAKIYEGEWLNDAPYITIHRIASGADAKGVFGAMLQEASSLINNIRIDTHRDNAIMQHVLEKHGFVYCGIIYLLSGDDRLAFQKIIR
ncbi:MAG: N-acetyltransferase [Bacteroidales bacterium]|nr:N-acetyltransferase [Bacteroidales bacterium]